MIRSHGLKADLYLPGDTTPIWPFLHGQEWDALRIDDLCRGRELDIGKARRLLGPELCLFGNMSSYALLGGELRDVEARARRQHEAAGSDGRLIVSNGSGICDRTRPEVIDAWLSFARSLR